MTPINKPKVIKDYDKLAPEILEQIKLVYPRGFRKHLVEFSGIDGKKRKGLPFETEEKLYLIRMTAEEAVYVIANDDDYDDNGRLKPGVQSRLADKHEDDYLDEFNSNDDNDYGEEEDDDFGDINIDDMDDDVEDEGSDASDDIDV